MLTNGLASPQNKSCLSFHQLPLPEDLGSVFTGWSLPWVKGFVFPLPFPAWDAQPTASKQSGQERAFSCCEGTRGLSLVQAEWGRASLLQVSLQEGKGFSARSFPAHGRLEEMLLGFAVMEGEISTYFPVACVSSLRGGGLGPAGCWLGWCLPRASCGSWAGVCPAGGVAVPGVPRGVV